MAVLGHDYMAPFRDFAEEAESIKTQEYLAILVPLKVEEGLHTQLQDLPKSIVDKYQEDISAREAVVAWLKDTIPSLTFEERLKIVSHLEYLSGANWTITPIGQLEELMKLVVKSIKDSGYDPNPNPDVNFLLTKPVYEKPRRMDRILQP